ncbi:MAG: SIMPL domain-containing protein [Candidatus Limnocylindrales bacterium]
MSTTSRLLGVGVFLGLAGGLLLGVGLMQPGPVAAVAASAAPDAPSAGVAIGAPAALPAVATSGTSVVSSGSAIAYPYFAGSPGVAPDHTVVVTGVGQADMQSDGSDQAAAQKTALAAALADAKTQADTIASDTGLTISGVLSVSASVSPSYGIEPMAGAASGSSTIVCPAIPPQASGAVIPEPVCPPVPQPVYQQTISVSVTVEYSVG